MSESELDFTDPLLCSISVDTIPRVRCFVIDSQTCGRTSSGEPVNTDPCKYLIVCPGIFIRPVVQLFVDPGEQCYRAVGEGVSKRLGLGALEKSVACALI